MLLLCWYNVLIYKSLRLYFLQLLNCFLCHAATDPFGLQILGISELAVSKPVFAHNYSYKTLFRLEVHFHVIIYKSN